MEQLVLSEALVYLTQRVPLVNIARVAGINDKVLNNAKRHCVVNGKPLYLSPDKTELVRNAVMEIGQDLLNTRLDTKYGDIADQLQELKSNYINIKYLTEILGKSLKWMRLRMTHQPYQDRLGKMRDYYNHFTEADIKALNTAIHTLALEVLSIEILDEYPPEVEQSQLLSNMDITSDYQLKSDEELQLLEDEMALGML